MKVTPVKESGTECSHVCSFAVLEELSPLISKKDWIEQPIVLKQYFWWPANFNWRHIDWDHFGLGYTVYTRESTRLLWVKTVRSVVHSAAISVRSGN